MKLGLSGTLAMALLLTSPASSASISPAPLSMLRATGTVDERFLSYNIEMVEVTGGRFWRPYGSSSTERYEYREPLNLGDTKLRALAKALAPAYVRFSGTWANATWFADGENIPEKPPTGFDTVLTRDQWRGAVDFSKATGGAIVTSFATSPGVRDASGVWQSDTAARWLAYTKKVGGMIAAAEFANEPNMISLTKPPVGYTSKDYRRDYSLFEAWLKTSSPRTLLLAPGYAELGEPIRSLSRKNKSMPQFEADELLTAETPRPDGFSFHFYGTGSERCGGKILGHSIDKALTPEWLGSVDPAIARMASLRDRVAPGVPLWNTETGEAACGGNPWASSYADSFRFVDTLGRSAQAGVRVVMHNTLSASDYGLLDDQTHDPRPNYWAAVLWKRVMGTTVLASPPSPTPTLRLYAHCLPTKRGAVGIVAINLGSSPQSVFIEGTGRAWIMHASSLNSKTVTISGSQPGVGSDGKLFGLKGSVVVSKLEIPGTTIAFIADPGTNNPACR